LTVAALWSSHVRRRRRFEGASRPYAIVVGLDLNGLGVVRSLGRAGVPTIALDTDLARPSCATRLARKLQVEALAGPGLIEALLRLRAALSDDPVLILTQEASVGTVSALRDRLSGCVRFSMPDHDLMTSLLDKRHFQELAERLGFLIPRAVRLARGGSAGVAAMLRYPCVVKPTTRHPEWGRRFRKAYKVSGVDDVAALWQQVRDVVDEVIVQEWIEGDDTDVHFCLQYRPADGHPPTSFVGRKLRQWPVLVGGTACCAPAPEAAAELTELTNGFFENVGFVGLGSMEYKRDRRDGRFYMIEPTVGRTDYQEEVATLNGKNIPLAAYLGEIGAPLPSAAPASLPVGWRDPIGDHNACAALPGTVIAAVPGVRFRDAYFRLDDPMPFIALKATGLTRRLTRLRSVAIPAHRKERSC
jgi:predicted ATP-grasp superfamily ATP-dependent carboligase